MNPVCPSLLSIYPNPVSDLLYIKGDASIMDHAFGTIYTSDGREMNRFSTSPDVSEIDVSSFTAGVYMLAITNAIGMTSVEKFVVMH